MPSSFNIVRLRLGILYQSTCVGFGYGLCGSYFLNSFAASQSNREQLTEFVTTHWLQNIDCIPSTTPFSLALGPANPAQISFTQEPLDFGDSVFSLFSLLMPAFALDTSRSPRLVSLLQAYRTFRYRVLACTPKASARGLSPLHFRRRNPYLDQ